MSEESYRPLGPRRITKMKIISVIIVCVLLSGCFEPTEQRSASGVTAVTQEVQTGSDGLTVEQRNIKDRLIQDNKPGAIQHLYVISAYSGQVLLYSTVRGKVTSSSKRLMPSEVSNSLGFRVSALSRNTNTEESTGWFYTKEILGDDGTYGSSVEYVYWWDSVGVYHQHYVQGGQIVHIASAPINVKSVVLNLETRVSGED